MPVQDHNLRICQAVLLPSHGHRHSRRAFTLLELVLVLVVIAVVMGLAAPSLRGFWRGATSRDAATQLLAVIQWARIKAISDSTVYRLNIDAQSSQYWLTVQEGQDFVPVGSDFGQTFVLPDDMRIELSDSPGQDYIDFFPSGRNEIATIRLTRPGEEEIHIACASPTERFRILAPEEVSP